MKRRVLRVVFAAAMGLQCSSIAGEAIRLVTGSNGADTFVREFGPDKSVDGLGYLDLRSRDVDGSLRHRVPVLRFELGKFSGAVDKAVLKLDVGKPEEKCFVMDVFGVADREELESWSAQTLTYANAPWLVRSDGTVSRDYERDAAVYLGSISYFGGHIGEVSLDSDALTEFIRSDKTGSATLFIEPQIARRQQDFWIRFRSDDDKGKSENQFYPTLELQLK